MTSVTVGLVLSAAYRPRHQLLNTFQYPDGLLFRAVLDFALVDATPKSIVVSSISEQLASMRDRCPQVHENDQPIGAKQCVAEN